MKKCLLILAVLIFINPSFSQINKKYQIDVKTFLGNTTHSMCIRYGVIANAKNSNWCEIKNNSPYYVLWIRNCVYNYSAEKKEVGLRAYKEYNIYIEFDLELRGPESALNDGELFKTEHFIIGFGADENFKDYDSPSVDDVLNASNDYFNSLKELNPVLIEVKNNLTSDKINSLIKILENLVNDNVLRPKFNKGQRIEAIICGAICYVQLKQWMQAKEKGDW